MILELDCGNSFIKWRVRDADDRMTICSGVAGSGAELISALQGRPERFVQGRMVSVRSEAETQDLIQALRARFFIDCVCARPAEELGGVRNGYEQFEFLGMDRWLALVGAYRLAGKACLVLDLGTAVTSDFVGADGRHLGGYICPGMPLMRNQLRTHTRRIRYDDEVAQRALQSLAPGRSTVEAVERGCSLMLHGFVRAQLELARQYWAAEFEVFLTGGDAELVEELIPGARVMPDLVFVGLAIACPLGGGV